MLLCLYFCIRIDNCLSSPANMVTFVDHVSGFQTVSTSVTVVRAAYKLNRETYFEPNFLPRTFRSTDVLQDALLTKGRGRELVALNSRSGLLGLPSGSRWSLAALAGRGSRAEIQITVLFCLLAHFAEINCVSPEFFQRSLLDRLGGISSRRGVNCGLIWLLKCLNFSDDGAAGHISGIGISSALEKHSRLRCETGRLLAEFRKIWIR